MNVNAGRVAIWSKFDASGGTNGGLGFEVNASGALSISYQGYGVVMNGSTVITTAGWRYVEVSRSGPTMRLFLEGTVDATATVTNNFTANSNTSIGGLMWAPQPALYRLNGNITELIVIKGKPLHTANYTPPVAPFPNNSGSLQYEAIDAIGTPLGGTLKKILISYVNWRFEAIDVTSTVISGTLI